MQVPVVLVLLSISVAICSATYGNYYYEGQPCQPSSPEVCQDRYLVREETTPAGSGYGLGEVCACVCIEQCCCVLAWNMWCAPVLAW